MIKDYLEIGEIVGTHGLKGELRVDPWCDEPAFFKEFQTLYYDSNGSAAVSVRAARPHGNIVLLCLEGVEDVQAAQALRGQVLYVRRADTKLVPGSYFIAELLGSEVRDADDAAKLYGSLIQVSKTGANDVWHVRVKDGREYLLPVIPEVVLEVNVEQSLVRIRPLKGIFDDAD